MRFASLSRADPTKLHDSAIQFLPSHFSLKSLRESAQGCRGCELFRHATQTVFGSGPAQARLMIIGEVPGDQEDRQGKPFVGPAGKLLVQCLEAAGAARSEVYLTNAVKHFKWEQRGKRRLHTKPSMREIRACRPWLEAEIEVVRPRTIVCLGATAAQTVFDRNFRLTQHLGKLMSSPLAHFVIATYHPSSALRAPDLAERHRIKNRLIHDLKIAVKSAK
ncbi:MAG TPA: UdgX family uracil-DNA binding protein [Pirellulales bacterium]|jgi:DNA polymerase|nr:UdgX family uracil-DNA binding protein [Pirellulales bacterium]